MMAISSIKTFAKKFRVLINSNKKFLVLTHVRPDGDAYGCLLAMAHSLIQLGKQVTLWNEDGIVERYHFLPGTEWITSRPLPHGPFDARIVLDTASLERVGKITLQPNSNSPIVNIDHHASNSHYGDLAFVDPHRASCGEVIFDLLKSAKMPMNKDVAKCLFVAISTDTGSFQYPAVTPSTFRTAAELLEYGIDLGELSRLTYESHPPRRLLLLREVLQSAKFDSDNRIGYFWINADSYKRSGAKPEDSEGMIDHIRSIRSVLVAVLFEEIQDEGVIRISLRSKDSKVDVNKIATQFGGGGHSAASGARISGTRQQVETRVLTAIRDALPQK